MKKKNQPVGNARKYMIRHESKVPFAAPKRQVPKARLPFYAVVFLVLLIAGGMVGAAFLGAEIATNNAKLSSSNTVINIDSSERGVPMSASGEKMTKAGVYAKVYSSVVKIRAGNGASFSDGGVQLYTGEGSGIIIGSNGEILTNYHVVAGATSIVVTLANGTSYTVDSIKGDELTDIAVLSINTDTTRVMATLATGEAFVNMAEDVVLLGYTSSNEDPTISDGIISGMGVNVNVDGISMKLLQTTAGINPGNSGGGLFNMYGNLIGIVNAKRVGEYVENVGYAIPSNVCLDIATQLIEKSYVTGRVDTNIVEFKEVVKVSSTWPWEGLYVVRDNTGKGSFIVNDYIDTVAGQKVISRKGWNKMLNSYIVGDTIDVVYWRDNKQMTVRLTLTQKKYCDS